MPPAESSLETIDRVCGTCHSLMVQDRCLAGDCTPEKTKVIHSGDWERLTDWMRAFNCRMTNEEQQTITEYLKTAFPWKPFSVTWTHVATVPMGWNIVSMTAIDDYLYIGVEGAGRIYRSADGLRWDEVLDTGGVAVYGITFFNGKLFAGADGEDPSIWASGDGKTWEKVAKLPEEERGVTAMGIFQGDLYLGTRKARVYRSSNGTDWRRTVELEEHFSGYVRFLTPFNDHLFAGIEPRGKVFRSSDGTAWENVSRQFGAPNGVRGNAVFQGAFYVGTNGPPQVWRTEDGMNWTRVFDPTPEIRHGYSGSMAVFGDFLYAGIHTHSPVRKDVFRTKNGESWEAVGEISPHTIEAMAPFGEYLYAGTLLPPLAQVYRTIGMIPSVIETATGDRPSAGTVTGTYRDTQTGYQIEQVIVEDEKARIDHTWRFKIRGGSRVTVAVKARLSAGESPSPDPGLMDVVFSYSTDRKQYQDLFRLVGADNNSDTVFYTRRDIPGGELYIRAQSNPTAHRTDQTASKHALHVDQLYVISEGWITTDRPAAKAISEEILN